MQAIQSNKEFNDLVKGEKPFVLDFYADWCGPCQVLLPTVEKLAEEFSESVTIAKINIDNQPELAQLFNVKSIPSLFFMQKNNVKDAHKGMASEKMLRDKINNLLA